MAATRANIGWNHAPFEIPEAVRAEWDQRKKGAAAQSEWAGRFAAYAAAHADLAREFKRRMAGELPASFAADAAADWPAISEQGNFVAFESAAGNLGANGIVGGGLPIAVGAGLSAKMRKSQQVCVCFFGDGASNEGAFHEALNMASIWKLPVVFVCENNKYGMSMDVARASAVPDIAKRASAYAMPGITVDGNDLALTRQTAVEAIERARRGEGPTLIECKTYRIRGHSKSDRNLYRTKEEIESWRQQCPIDRLKAEALDLGRIDAKTFAEIDRSVEAEIEAALEFAVESPMPDPARLMDDVYAESLAAHA